MTGPQPCPRCGSDPVAGSPGGLCPGCLLRGVLDPSADPTSAGVLETLGATAGPMPRVLLRDTGDFNGPGPVVRPSSPEMPETPDRAGRLQLFGEIARGGMGAVIKGRDNDLGRDLAVKVLLERHGDDPGLLRRFVEEAQIAGQLQHPGIVPVYELGTFADRRPYFAMKLVKGRTLAEVLAERAGPSLDHPRLLAIFLDVAQTMAYAHARGVIHRDLKPSNVMVGSFGEVQVMDWGLAKVLPRGGAVDDRAAGKLPADETVIATARSGSGSDLSQAGSVLGTPSYMAPEQARGENDHLDERADVFALGSILGEILTGQPAFTGRSQGEILRNAASGDVAEALGRLEIGGTDAELVALARSCLAADPKERPRDAGQVARALTAYLAGVQRRLRAAEISEVEARARAEEDRKRRKVTLALAASILATAGVIGGGWAWLAGQRARRIEAASRAVAEAVGDVRLLQGQARGAPLEDPAPWARALESARSLEGQLARDEVEPAVRGGARAVVDSLRAEGIATAARAAEARADRDVLRRLAEIRLGLVGGEDPSRADRLYAAALRDHGIDVKALPPAEAGARIARRRDAVELMAGIDQWIFNRQAEDDISGARRLAEVARVADPDPWRTRLRTALVEGDVETLRRSADTVDLDAVPARTAQRLGYWLARNGEVARGLALLRELRRRDPRDTWINYDLATAYFTRARPGDDALAARYLTAAVAAEPRNIRARFFLGYVLYRMGDLEGAEAESREGIRLSPGDFKTHGILGLALQGQGRLDEALACFREGIRLGPGYAQTGHNIADALKDAGRLEEALAEVRRASDLAPPGSPMAREMPEVIRDLERRIDLTPRLAGVLKGSDVPRDAAEGLAFARLCHDLRQYSAAARLYAAALAADPKPVGERPERYAAARDAVLAGCGVGKDDPPPDEAARARLRRQALDWLRAEHLAWSGLLESGPPQGRPAIVRALRQWRDDPDLAGVRDPDSLGDLPADEREAWRSLWADVDALLLRARGGPSR